MRPAPAPGLLARLPILLMSAVFALGFGLGGVFAGVRPILLTLASAWEVRDWRPVGATVLEAELHEHRGSKGSVSYTLRARYRYTVGEHSHEGRRIGLDQGFSSDNVGDWHERWHEQLLRSREQGLRVLAWVNPRQPEQALLDPHIRWALVAFQLPFALLFTGVGAAAAWVFWRTCRGEPMPGAAAGRPAGSRLAHGVAALYWCGLTWPLVLLVWLTDAHWVPRLVITAFGLVGVGLFQAWQRKGR
ncbi:MAG: DUF3592 domain-containing protein [Burkholderiales bacterium]|nr:DUF3592 domain-containing protein [Burkholderiales bacterium]